MYLPLTVIWITIVPQSYCNKVQQDNQRFIIKLPMWSSVNLTHALTCRKGGFVIIRHNEIRHFNADLLKKVCNDVQVEPQLQPLNDKQVYNGSVTGDEACLDIRARGFWCSCQSAFFDM